MASIKEYQRKIISLKNTRKITGSMKMISSIKLQRMARMRDAMLPFCGANRSLRATVAALNNGGSVFTGGWNEPKSAHYLVMTSDRGMCGRFNTNTIRSLLVQIDGRRQTGGRVSVSCIGRKGYAHLKRHGADIRRHYADCAGRPSWDAVRKVADELFTAFVDGTDHELWVVYSKRTSSFSEEPVVERLLPFSATDSITQDNTTDYIVEEPSGELIRKYAELMLQGMLYEALVETGVAEHAARMSAMDNASSNCDRMTARYVQLRNRARQAAITTELNEIVTGKEALQS